MPSIVLFVANMLRSPLRRKFLLRSAILAPAVALLAFYGMARFGPLLGFILALFAIILAWLLPLGLALDRLVILPIARILKLYAPGMQADGLIPDELIPDNEIGDLIRTCNRMVNRTEQRYRQLLDLVPVGLYELDSEGRIIAVNQTLLDWLGRTRQEVIGMPFDTLLSDEQAIIFGQLRERCRQGEPVRGAELRLKRKDGSLFLVQLNTISAFDDAGRHVCRGTIQDLTREKQLESQLLQAQKMEALGLLAGGVAHDFNNILTVMLGNIELAMGNGWGSASYQQYLDQAREAGERAVALVRQLLLFSRRQALAFQPVNIAELLANTTSMLRRLISEEIELVLEVAQDVGTVYADQAALEQVLMNLAVNARDAMPDGGILTIQGRNIDLDQPPPHADVKPGRYVQVSVADTGIGMDEATLGRIFEPFFTTKQVGTGLGLSVSYGIIRHHNGFISVESAPGRGARFDIYLPLYTDSTERSEASLPEAKLAGGNETILVADDDQAVREVIRAALDMLGYTVLLASNGQEAFEIFVRNRDRIRLVILDAVMPLLGGAKALALMRTIAPNLAGLLLTGHSAPVYRGSDQLVDVPLLHKPLSIKELAHKVREILNAQAPIDRPGRQEQE